MSRLCTLAFLSLLFAGAASGWAEDDKAGAAAAEAHKKQEYLEKVKKDPAAAILEQKDKGEELAKGISAATVKGDSAWLAMSSALVMLMVPGLALFYGGMVRRKNVLATMMQSMVALSVVGVYWIVIGYALAFGDPWISIPAFEIFGTQVKTGGLIGFSPDLVMLQGVDPDKILPGSNIPVYLHVLFQGMFAIITPALISGAVAERIRFGPYCLFLILWVTLIYCPLAHCVWAMDWNWANALLEAPAAIEKAGESSVGWLGVNGALDFAGGTVVHIAAGFSALAAILVLRKRIGYPQQAMHPGSMVLTLTGAGLLWFGWFGFNGGSALASGELAITAFAATQAAAAAAGLTWMLAEWLHRGKPTALGLASGVVAGLVAVTPASGFVLPWGGLAIGAIGGVVCYISVTLKGVFKYDDSLDAFGVHGVGGFLGAVLTGVFCVSNNHFPNPTSKNGLLLGGGMAPVVIQLIAALVSAIGAFVLSLILVKLVDLVFGFTSDIHDEIAGLDRTEHGETGFDFGLATEATAPSEEAVPRSASMPPNGKRFQVVMEGAPNDELMKAWSALCQPNKEVSFDFKAVYPFFTTVEGNRFRFRGGNPDMMRDSLKRLLQAGVKSPLQARVED